MIKNHTQPNQTKIPKLRFSDFNGVWKEKKLGEFLIPELREITKPKSLYKGIGLRSHFKGTFQRDDSDPSKISMDKLFEVKEKDFLVNITFAWEGALAIAKKEDEGGLVSHRFPTYIFNKKITTPEYFQFVFPTRKMKYILENISPGGAGRNRVLNKKDFLKIKINLPELPEQQKIASFLGSVDEWIANLRAQHAGLAQYKKGMMQKIFSQQIRFKDNKGNDFPKWEDRRLKEIGVFKSGVGFKDSEQGGKQGIPFYKVSDMNIEGNEKEMFFANHYVTQEQIDRLKYKPINEQSIIFAKVGAAIFLERKRIAKNFLFDNNMMAFTPHKFVNIYFIKYTLDTIRLSRFAQTGALPSYNSSDVGTIKLKLPSFSEQQKIAEFLSSVDQLLESKQQQITEAKNWKKGLMQGLFV